MSAWVRYRFHADAEVLRRQVFGAVAGKCISGASAEAATDAVMDVIAGLLADPTTRAEWGAVVAGEICRHDTERAARDCARTLGHGQIVRREVTAWTTVADAPAADDEGGQER